MRPRLARLRDALLAHRLRSVGVVAQVLVQPVELLFSHLGKVVDGLPVDTPGAPVRFHAPPGHLEVLPLVHLVDKRVDLPLARRVQPVGKSPRSLMFGSFAHGTVHLSALAHLTVLSGPDRLRRPPSPTHSVAARAVTSLSPRIRCRVGGGAPRGRWPPSAAQTVRAVFPHTAFTKTFSRDEDRWRNQRVEPSSGPSGSASRQVSSVADVGVFHSWNCPPQRPCSSHRPVWSRPSSPAAFPNPLGCRPLTVTRLSPRFRYYSAVRLLDEHPFPLRSRL